MADVDGTLTPGREPVSPAVIEATRLLEKHGIIVGLVSGRTLPMLESLANVLGISGPIIAENGAVARTSADGEFIDLGYSRQPAIEALKKLKALFPDSIKEREDNKDRLVDIVFWLTRIETEELSRHLDDTQLLDSGYILHLMQNGISKGKTLMRLLEETGEGTLTPLQVMVFGDSSTDLSLFELFPHSVLIPNPRLPFEHRQILEKAASFTSDLPFGDGFAEVAFHLINICTRSDPLLR